MQSSYAVACRVRAGLDRFMSLDSSPLSLVGHRVLLSGLCVICVAHTVRSSCLNTVHQSFTQAVYLPSLVQSFRAERWTLLVLGESCFQYRDQAC